MDLPISIRMHFSNPAKKLMAVLMLLAIILPTCAALEANVILAKDFNLSVDIGPEFNISTMSTHYESGLANAPIFGHEANITNSKDPNQNISLGILSLYDTSYVPPVMFRKLLKFAENTTVGGLELMGLTEIGKQSVMTNNGQNVTIHELKAEDGFTAYYAMWNIDDLNGIMALSSLDLNTTAQIIKTLEVKS